MIRPQDSPVFLIIDYIHEQDNEDLGFATDEEVMIHSYKAWALCESLRRVMDHPFEDPKDILENFLLELKWLGRTKRADGFGVPMYDVAFNQIETILALFQSPSE